MRLRCQCPRPPAGRLGTIRPARLIAASAAVLLGVLALAVSAPSASAQTPMLEADPWTTGSTTAPSRASTRCTATARRSSTSRNDLAQYTGIIDDITAARQQAARGIEDDRRPTPAAAELRAHSNDPGGGALQPGDRQARPDELRLDPASAPDPRRPRADHGRRRRRRARLAPPQGAKSRCYNSLFPLHPTQPLTSQVRSTTAVPPPGRSLVRLDQEVEEWRPRSPQKPHSTRSRTKS